MQPGEGYVTVDNYERLMGSMVSLPDVTHTKPTTINNVSPLTGKAQMFTVQTYRQREVGDTIFLVYVDERHIAVRVAIPPQVAEAIARQRDSLTTKVRRKIGKANAEARKARGELPAFMKKKKSKK